MFGSKTKLLRAENQRMDNDLRSACDLFARIADQDDRLQGYYADMEESKAQLAKGRNQLAENTDAVSALLADTTGCLGQMVTALGLLGQQMLVVHNAGKEAKENSDAMQIAIGALEEGLLQAGVGNEQEITTTEDEKTNVEKGEELLSEMSGLGKEMGVLALNAAIEAGRMGEDGMQFMQAAEQVRAHAARYDQASMQMREVIEEDQKRIKELEKRIADLTGCIEESKKSAAALKEQQESTKKVLGRISGESMTEQLSGIKDVLQKTADCSEQAAKIEERSSIQLADMEEEARVYIELNEEAKEQMRPLLDEAADYSLHLNH